MRRRKAKIWDTKGKQVFDLHRATLVFLWVHNNSVHLLDAFAHLINKMYV